MVNWLLRYVLLCCNYRKIIMSLQLADMKIGDSLPPYTASPLTSTDLVRYAGASGEAVTTQIDNRSLRKFNVRFAGMTEPVDYDGLENTTEKSTITIASRITDKFEEHGEKTSCNNAAKYALGGKLSLKDFLLLHCCKQKKFQFKTK
jgi:hypothetical protein